MGKRTVVSPPPLHCTCGYRVGMPVAATTKVPFADASPAQLREAILPEDVPEFDRHYQRALDVARTTLRLDELEKFLELWRRVAWSTNANGHDRWRAVLAEAQRRLAGGPPPPGMVPMEEMEARIQARLASQ